MKTLKTDLIELELMHKAPKEVWYIGNTQLLFKRKVSIVGTRRPSSYTKDFTFKLAKALSNRGIVVVSGAAMGVDATAHRGAGVKNTIAVMANGLDTKYPAVNKNLIVDIEKNGLTLSFYKPTFKATRWSFVARNELVVALGEILIVTEAELKSGSMRSVEYALKMDKQIYVLPHRLNESSGTNWLLKENKAKAIYDIETFANSFGEVIETKDAFIKYLENSPSFEEALALYGDKIYEAELEGAIAIENGIIRSL